MNNCAHRLGIALRGVCAGADLHYEVARHRRPHPMTSKTRRKISLAATSHQAPLPQGDSNQNPDGIGLLQLLAEDFRTHDRLLTEPGFWAVALHRLGNARMDVKPKLLRAPLSVGYKVLFTGINWAWGIDLSYTVKVGRRVRIWHHGGIWIGARSIGNDVHIRHNTTLGVAARDETSKKPIIGDRVDIGTGACVLGAVTVGDDCVIGANSVVLKDLPKGSVAFGVPARPVNLKANELALRDDGETKTKAKAK